MRLGRRLVTLVVTLVSLRGSATTRAFLLLRRWDFDPGSVWKVVVIMVEIYQWFMCIFCLKTKKGLNFAIGN